MKTIINIGCSLGNITNVEINKPFDKIDYLTDIVPIIKKRYGNKSFNIYGWGPTPTKEDNDKIEDDYDDYDDDDYLKLNFGSDAGHE